MMITWPRDFMQAPQKKSWTGAPYDTRAAFSPEQGPPLYRSRTTAEAWSFKGTFPLADEVERAAFWTFWAETHRGTKDFLWRDPADGQIRRWKFGVEEPARETDVTGLRRDIAVSVIRLPSTPWWTVVMPPGPLVAPRAAYDFRRGLYHNGVAQVSRPSAVSFSRTSEARYFDAAGVMLTAAAGAPRFDHNSATQARRGLLIEAAATNLALHSAALENAAWDKTRASITANVQLAPDGTLTADRLVEDATATSSHYISTSPISFTAGLVHTFSVFVRAGERSHVGLWLPAGVFATDKRANFNLAAGTVALVSDGATAGIEALAGGWFRVWISARAEVTATARILLLLARGPNNNDAFYTGTGAAGLHLWGAQAEVGADPTSYIPTAATAVTRAADQAGLVAAHGACDVRVIYDDGTTSTIHGQSPSGGWWPVEAPDEPGLFDLLERLPLTSGWWPRQRRPHVAAIGIFEPGALA